MVPSGDKKAGQTLVVTSPGPPVGRGRPGLKGNTPGALPGVSSHSAGLPPAHVMLGTTRGEVFSNKTQVIPLGGHLCPKASLFHPTQQSPGARGRHGGQSVIYQRLTTGSFLGGRQTFSTLPPPPPLSVIPPHHTKRLSFHERPGEDDRTIFCRPSTSAQLTWSHCASAQSLS